MTSHPGDNRTALIAALIAIPSAALITMAVHTFVPVQQTASPAGLPVHAPEKGDHHSHGGERTFRREKPHSKENFKKMFLERRKKQTASLQKIVELSKKKCLLLKKNNASPQEILQAETGYMLAQADLLRHQKKVRFSGTPSVVAQVIKTVSARKMAQLDQIAFKSGKGSETAALKSEIQALQMELQLANNRLNRNPQWQEALKAYQKQQNTATLQNLIEHAFFHEKKSLAKKAE